MQYNVNSENNPNELFNYCKKFVNGFKKITILELKKNICNELTIKEN